MDYPKSVPGVGLVNGKFVDDNPITGAPGSLIPAEWGNAVTDEILGVIQKAGLTPDETDHSQLAGSILAIVAKAIPSAATESTTGIVKLSTTDQVVAGVDDATAVTPKKLLQKMVGVIQGQTLEAFTTGGAAPAFTLNPVPAITTYAANQRFQVKFSAASTGVDTLNWSGLGPRSLRQYDAGGNKVPAVFAAGTTSDVFFDGIDMVVLDPLPTSLTRQLQPVSASVAANALTLGLSITSLDFRSPTLSSGAVNSRFVSSALSLVVPAGATLGSINGVTSRLVILAIDNAGSVELAVVNLAGGNNLDETMLINTTAISNSAGSNSIIYSAVPRANVPFRVVGFIDSIQAIAGNWSVTPTIIQGAGGQAIAGLSSIGYGQNWQSVTASRVVGTVYTNTTGKPIMVAVSIGSNPYQSFSLYVNGGLVASSNSGGINYSQVGFITAIIPHGANYFFTVTAGAVSTWCELR
ncbi:hypothetical protein [Pseudomonas gingeri]